MSVAIYHNPRCSKSRQTLQLLEEQGVEPEIIEYLKTPPDMAGLKKILKMLGMEPRELMRKKEKEYKEGQPLDVGQVHLPVPVAGDVVGKKAENEPPDKRSVPAPGTCGWPSRGPSRDRHGTTAP